MLEFFRKYQRYVFIVISIVIIISFSFFGTYSTLDSNSFREQIAFTAVDGKEVTRHELDEMALFIGTDADDKLLFGGIWGPNFFNDGVIKKDFLQTGLAGVLVAQYPELVQPDLKTRFEKEKRYSLYVNPQARFIGTETAWSYFAPELKTQFYALRSAPHPLTPEAFASRVALYLGEKQFPSPLLRQVLRYQEKQYSWLTPDPFLNQVDLSLFGYHTIEDWFGPRFVRLVAEFIINSAKIAEKKGYRVTKADVLADLQRNSERSFQQNRNNPNVGVADGTEYFSEQLRRMGMDQNKAIKIWQQVMLFRRFFHDVGSSVFVDTFTPEKFDAYAMEMVDGELYRVPQDLQLNDYRTLQKFEVYLDAVSKRPSTEKGLLMPPKKFLSVDEISKQYPELVQKRYLLEMSQTDKKALQAKVGVKESWNWEVDDKNWDTLKQQFPDLGIKKGDTREERFAVLDSLDDQTRARVDTFARTAIVDAHPEWLTKALEEAPTKQIVINLHENGGSSPIVGLTNRKDLIRLLDTAPLANEDSSTITAAGKAAADQLSQFSRDQNTYYRLTVIDRSPKREVLTFAEANKEGVLDSLLDQQLEAYYQKIREGNSEEFKKDDSWKPIEEVKDRVADLYFENILKAIQSDYAKAIAPEKAPPQMIGDFAAHLRLYAYAREAEDSIRKRPEARAEWSREPPQEAPEGKLPPRESLDAQWKLERLPYQLTRSSEDDLLDKTTVFNLEENDWTKVYAPLNGNLHFFHVKSKGNGTNSEAIASQVKEARALLSDDAQQSLMTLLLQEFKDKNAISLDYLSQIIETPSHESSIQYEEL
jgi:GcvH upstream region-like protein